MFVNNIKALDVVNELVAGLIVGILAVPQGLALAKIAGLPPVYGLYNSVFGALPYALLGTSPYLIVGPTAVLSLVVRSAVPKTIPEASLEWVGFATTLSFFSGLMQVGMGYTGFGTFIQLVGEPVLNGFITASAVLIILSQVSTLFGIAPCSASALHGAGHEFDECFLVEHIASFAKHAGDVHVKTAICSLLSILFLIVFPLALKRKLPMLSKTGPMILLALALGVFSFLAREYGTIVDEETGALSDAKTGIGLIGEIPTGLPLPPTSPFEHYTLTSGVMRRLLTSALVLAMLGFMESFAIASSIKHQRKSEQSKLVPKSELVALGVCNLVSSVTKGFPVCGTFGRTAVNAECGAKLFQASSMVSCVVVLLVLLVLSGEIKYVPNFALAAIVVQSVCGLVNPWTAWFMFQTNSLDFITFAVTVLVTGCVGFEPGLVCGILVSWSGTLLRFQPIKLELRRKSVHTFNAFVDSTRSNLACDLALLRLESSLQFRVTQPLEQTFQDVCDLFHPQCVALDLSKCETIDFSGIQLLQHFSEQCAQNMAVPNLIVIGLSGDARRVVERATMSKDTLQWNLAPKVNANYGQRSVLLAFETREDAFAYCYGRIEPRQEANSIVLSAEAFEMVDEARISRWRQGGNQADAEPGCRLPSFGRKYAFELAVAAEEEE